MKTDVKAFFVILIALHLAFPFAVKAADLSFSARLVNDDGSPVAGPVELSFELAYSSDTSDILCSKDLSDVALSSGVFHANLEFGTDECVNSKELAQVLQETPSGESLMMRVSDETDGANVKTYPFQALNTVPMSVMSEISQTLSQMGADEGEVLKWVSGEWVPKEDEGKDGTVISITAGDGLDGGTITETGTIKVKSGGIVVGMLAPDSVTSAKIDDKTIQNVDIKDGQIEYDKLNLQDNDIQASKVAGLKGAAFVDVGMDSGMAMQPNDVPNCAADEKLQMSALPVYPRSWSCVGESTGMDDTKLPLAGGTMSGAIDMGGNEVINLLAPNSATDATTKQYVDDGLADKANTSDLDNYVARAGDNMTGAFKLDAQNELRLADSDSNEYVGLRSHANVVGNYVLTFPADTGASDQVLSTDGSGNLSWTTPSTTATPEGSAGGELAGTYPNPTIDDNVIDNANIAVGANVEATKLGTGAVDNTEFNRLNGVTSSIQNQLDGKEDSLPAGGSTSNFLRGDKTWQALTTDDVSEATNKYFLDSRAQTAVVRQTITSGETSTSPSEDVLNTALAGKADNADLDSYVLRAGDSMSGNLDMGTNTVTNLATPSATSDAATKQYVDDGLSNKAESTDLDNYVAVAGDNMTGTLQLDAQNELRLADTGSTNYVALRSSASVTTYTLTLPDSVGTLDQVLSTDGSGNLSWSTPSTTATPEGSAGGELAGTYPNPTIEDGVIDNANIATGANIDAAKLGTGDVDNTEFSTLDGVTSSIQTQLDAKEGTITAGATTEYWSGDKTWQTLNTAAVAETTNLYFTDQRAKDATVDNAINAAETQRAPSQSAVASALGDYVLKAGDTMTGALELPADGLEVGTDQIVATAGNVGIGTASPQASALLDVSSTSQGFLPPRMTTAQRDAIAGPATGLIVFNTTLARHQYFNGTKWVGLSGERSTTVGLVGAFPTDACPSGWLKADGSNVSRTMYSSLFASVGEIYGSGDGSTTFTLPDYRGEFLRGVDSGAGNDPDAATRTNRGDGTTGDNVGTKQSGEMQSHNHNIDPPSTNTNSSGVHKHDVRLSDDTNPGTGGGVARANNNTNGGLSSNKADDAGSHYHSLNIAAFNSSSSGGSETRPRNVNVTYCVNYQGGTVGPGTGDFEASGSVPMTGNLMLNDNWLSNDGDNEGIKIDSSGNVGVGTSTPTAKLEVNGEVKASNFQGSLNGVKMAGGKSSFSDGSCGDSVGSPCVIDISGGGFSVAPACTITMENHDATSYTEKMVVKTITTSNLEIWRGNYNDAGTTMKVYWTCIGG